MSEKGMKNQVPDSGRRNLLKKLSLALAGTMAASVPGQALVEGNKTSPAGEFSQDSIFRPREDARLRMAKGKKEPAS